MKTKLLLLLMLAGSSMFGATRFFVGVGVGAPYPYYAPRPVAVYAAPPVVPYEYVAPAPGLGYHWVGGYYYPYGARYVWRPGYWARPPYAGAYWSRPYYRGGVYYHGYWRR
jgi:hypothetical protein